jgi:hypothetical protein
MRFRLVWLAAGLLVALGAAGYYFVPSAASRKTREVTERVASALARNDRAALAQEPCFQGKPETIAWLQQRGSPLADGYRVIVCRNGARGHTVLSPADVTHLGEIKTTSGSLTLGFKYIEETGELQFVTASGEIWVQSPPDSKPSPGEIRLGSEQP